jgi:hypothetical protein
MDSKRRTVSWIVLAVLGVLVLLVSLLSASIAYRDDFEIGGVSIVEIAAGREAVLVGLRGARGTAAAWGAAWAVLFLAMVVGPYRHGEVKSWWGILASLVVLSAVAAARVPFTGGQLGVSTPLILLAVGVLALLIDVKRLSEPR